MEGDVFINEPVGRLIRRAKVENKDGLTFLRNAYDKSEFLRSTDPYFRPVNITTGPDGCLYITDMYRGIIQQAAWVNEGSYLRKVVKKYGIQNVTAHGRIWRLVYEGNKPGPMPHMLDETPAQLVAHLDHPNGWWRDQAQMLLVLTATNPSCPRSMQMARGDNSPLARIHALWTLEGLDALECDARSRKTERRRCRTSAHRRDPLQRSADPEGRQITEHDSKRWSKDTDPNVVLQVLLTGKSPNGPTSARLHQ